MKPISIEYYGSDETLFDLLKRQNETSGLDNANWRVSGLQMDGYTSATAKKHGVRYQNTFIARDATTGLEIDRLECASGETRIVNFAKQLPAKPRAIRANIFNRCWMKEYGWAVALVLGIIVFGVVKYKQTAK